MTTAPPSLSLVAEVRAVDVEQEAITREAV